MGEGVGGANAAPKPSAQRGVPAIGTPQQEERNGEENAADMEVVGIQSGTASRHNENRASTRQGNWMTRELSRPKTASSWRRASQPNNQRPQTALPRSRQLFGSDSWRSASRTDFRAPPTSMHAPKLNIRSTRKRPTSAQPLLRLPGDCTAPHGSRSGFRL